MRKRLWITMGVTLVLFWVAAEALGGRGGGRGGGGGRAMGGGRPMGGGYRPSGGMPSGGYRPSGGMPSGGYRPSGGMPSGGYRPSGGNINRTPSFSNPGGGARPVQLPSGGRPAQVPGGGRPSIGGPSVGGGRPGIGGPSVGGGPARPNIGGGSVLPGGGARPGGRPSQLPSLRPDGRPSTLPGLGAGAAAGAGLGNRLGDRPAALPGLGDGRPGASQLPARTPGERRDALQDRLGGKDRPWNERRNDWQNQRDDIRNDWQNHRDQAREDWQNWFDDRYGWYGGWYGGYAPGYWGRWDYLWDNHPVAAAVGLTWWGANRLGYWFGCSDYTNPYYTESMPSYCAEPAYTVTEEYLPAEPAAAASGGAPAAPAVPPAVAQFDQARVAFYEGKYDEALKITDAAITQMPKDAVLHEFRALVLFALGRYAEAAATLHPVLDVGPGWDWKTMSSLYPSTDTYTKQLRALEADAKAKGNDAALRFLLGYHYLTLGYQEQAVAQFRQAAQLQPKDTVAAALAATLSPRDAKPTTSSGPVPPEVPADKLVGDWTAAGASGSKFGMNLRKDGSFVWTYSKGARKQEAKGVYSVEGNVLAMEPDTGGVMLAELTSSSPDKLRFKMVGGGKDDPPLDFQRGASQ